MILGYFKSQRNARHRESQIPRGYFRVKKVTVVGTVICILAATIDPYGGISFALSSTMYRFKAIRGRERNKSQNQWQQLAYQPMVRLNCVLVSGSVIPWQSLHLLGESSSSFGFMLIVTSICRQCGINDYIRIRESESIIQSGKHFPWANMNSYSIFGNLVRIYI